ncbi:hypothetical protein QFZ28_000713 [Neobacillus niacini]|uniref:hypothetical protein n=1 Tax=Neobacillus niacini TaxID=86668 RepID=UPI00278148AC|nr:hypothetical protein [Neobacillus niacini]MDQ1000313.1 hypothetical protein [Neobacillus niacini]
MNAIETDIVNKETISGKIESIYDSRDIQLNLVVKEGKKELLKGIDSIEYTPTDPGFYSLIFQVTKEDKIVYEKELLKGFIGAGVYELNSVDFRAIDDEIEIKINTDTNDLTYAYYIYENGSIKEKIMYQKNNELRFPVQKSGSYQVQYFIKDKNGKISINITPRLKV